MESAEILVLQKNILPEVQNSNYGLLITVITRVVKIDIYRA